MRVIDTLREKFPAGLQGRPVRAGADYRPRRRGQADRSRAAMRARPVLPRSSARTLLRQRGVMARRIRPAGHADSSATPFRRRPEPLSRRQGEDDEALGLHPVRKQITGAWGNDDTVEHSLRFAAPTMTTATRATANLSRWAAASRTRTHPIRKARVAICAARRSRVASWALVAIPSGSPRFAATYSTHWNPRLSGAAPTGPPALGKFAAFK